MKKMMMSEKSRRNMDNFFQINTLAKMKGDTRLPYFDERYFIERIQHGDTEAFNPLVQKYHPKIYTHIFGHLKFGKRKDAEHTQSSPRTKSERCGSQNGI